MVCQSAQMASDARTPGRVVVVGGGISGLSAAWFARQRPDPPDVVVLEAARRIGGKLVDGDLAGHQVDAGAEALLARRPDAVDLLAAVGLGELVERPVTTAARVMVDGVLHPYPAGTVLGVPGDVAAVAASGTLTRRGMARLRAERVLPARPEESDVSVGRYVSARMGREVTERLVEPLLGGVYAGHADHLSLQATMPTIAAARRGGERLTAAASRLTASGTGSADGSAPFVGVRGGLARLPQRLAATPGVSVRTGVLARELSRRADGRWQVVVGPVPSPDVLVADGVVLAVPAGPAARLLRQAVPAAASLLEVIEYASIGVVALAYRRPDVPSAAVTGSGHLVPPREGRVVKAVTYSSRKWGWLARTVPDLMLLRSSVGRFAESSDLRREDADLVRVASDDLSDVLGISARPVAGSVFRWGGSLPQYTVGHTVRARRVHEALHAHPGLALCGAALDGVGVPACIASARAAAEQVLRAIDCDDTMSP